MKKVVAGMLRRRMTLVHHRTALMLSFKSLYTRTTGQEMTLSRLKEMEIKEAQQLYAHPANQLIAAMQIKHIEQLNESIAKIEKGVLDSARELPFYTNLLSLPGVGRILGMTITMEVARSNALLIAETSPNATTNSAASGMTARRPRPVRWSPLRRWPVSWPRPPGI